MAKKKPTARVRRRPQPVHRAPPGSSPGQIIVQPGAAEPVLRVIAYGEEKVAEQDGATVADLDRYLGHFPVTWVDVAGLGNAATLVAVAERFGIHRLALEDVVDVFQRPKVESFGDHFLIVLRQPWYDVEFRTEQISLFVGPHWVLSFQEQQGDAYDPVRARLRTEGRHIRSAGADYLGYALIDAVLDAYFPILERFGEEMEMLQDDIMLNPKRQSLTEVYRTKHALADLRRATWPLRETLNVMIRDPLPGMTEETRVYLRDAYDHAILAMEITESYRDMGAELMDFYLSSVGNRTNEIMKVLTIIGAVFIPLTFIAGIYGMNFDPESSGWNMPELRWAFGYPAALILMLIVAIAMLLYFRRKGWIGGD